MNPEPVRRQFQGVVNEVDTLLKGIQAEGGRAFAGGDFVRAQELAEQAKALAQIRQQLIEVVKQYEALYPIQSVVSGTQREQVIVPDANRPAVRSESGAQSNTKAVAAGAIPIELRLRNGVHAFGEYRGETVIVKAGSTVSRQHTAEDIGPSVLRLRNELIKSGKIEDASEIDSLLLTTDQTFKSLTAAGQFVAGYSINGPKEWKSQETGERIEPPK